MLSLVAINRYDNIFHSLMKWKVMSLKNLYISSMYSKSYKAFKRLLNRLEKHKLLFSCKESFSTKKVVTLSDLFIRAHGGYDKLYIDKSTLFHDATVTNIGMELMKLDAFTGIKLAHEHPSSCTIPDAVLSARLKEIDFTVGLEVEITLKEAERIQNKFLDYCEYSSIDYVIYFFPTESMFKSYRDRLYELIEKEERKEIKKLLSSKILFAYKDNIFDEDCEISRAVILINGRETTLGEVFKEEKKETTPEIRQDGTPFVYPWGQAVLSWFKK